MQKDWYAAYDDCCKYGMSLVSVQTAEEANLIKQYSRNDSTYIQSKENN